VTSSPLEASEKSSYGAGAKPLDVNKARKPSAKHISSAKGAKTVKKRPSNPNTRFDVHDAAMDLPHQDLTS
jgi:hypothetical protein